MTAMNRREFVMGGLASVAPVLGCATAPAERNATAQGRILFGACRSFDDAPLMKSVGFDFLESSVATAFDPKKDEEWWKGQRDRIRALALPVRSCNGFLPGSFRLTGPEADFEPALAYAEKALRRADEVGVATIVFGSSGARNVPGDFCAKTRPDVEKGVEQYADFCRQLTARVADLKKVTVVIEPLRPNETNIVNYVWQGVQICRDVNSPRLAQLADIYHMMMGREPASSLVEAGDLLRHCHVASYQTRQYPGSEPAAVDRLRPYFAALKTLGYSGGVSCECGWGGEGTLAQKFETALKTLKGLV